MRLNRFAGLTVLVTGASSGIGHAFAEALARRKANLILTARSEDLLQPHAAALRQVHGIQVRVVAADLAGSGAARALAARIDALALSVDVLVNNPDCGGFAAGNGIRPEHDDRVVSLDIDALVQLTWLFLPGMQARRRGGVINVASPPAFQSLVHATADGAGKAFVVSFSEAVAEECRGSGVSVMALCPGRTCTQVVAAANAQLSKVPAATPAAVVAGGLKAFARGDACYVHGTSNDLPARPSRLFPRRVAAALSARISRGFFKGA